MLRLSAAAALAALAALVGAAPAAANPPDTYTNAAADRAWRDSIRLGDVPPAYDGSGVTVAVLDTGVTRHPDLGDRVVARVDLTPEGDGYDRYGHGSHMIGVLAGDGSASGGQWAGAAPGASLLPVKVAGWDGATDASAVIAGLEWIALNHARYGIRVVNISYGADSSQKYLEDPLNEAVERLWEAGVLVVAGAGNRGDGGSKVEKPGDDPYVVTVGAAHTRGTADPADDLVADFSSRGPTGDGVAKPDLLAPGVAIVSQRATGGTIDTLRPEARVGEHYLKGTGTSQAAAVVSGVAARMFEAAPALTPDEAKAALVGTATPTLAGLSGAGAGLVDAAAAVRAAVLRSYAAQPANVGVLPASGNGKIDSSRGSYKPYTDWKEPGKAEQLSGEYDAFGQLWDGAAWAAQAWTAAAWQASRWARHTTVSTGWEAPSAQSAPWRGLGWDETTWIARSWGELPWIARSWGARSWGARSWGTFWNG